MATTFNQPDPSDPLGNAGIENDESLKEISKPH